MNWLENLVYGLLTGFARFVPISSTAHQTIFHTLCGVEQPDPLQNLLIDIALFATLIIGFKPYFAAMYNGRLRTLSRSRRYQRDNNDETLVVRNAVIPMLIISLVLYYTVGLNNSLLLISATLLINGFILFIPSRMIQGNKNGRSMSILDSYMIGIVSALSAMPGFSGIGCAVSSAKMRGTDTRKALHWAALLSAPMLLIKIFVDLTLLFSANGFSNIHFSFGGYLLSVIGAYIGGHISIMVIRGITVRSTFSNFAYYSWGAALFSFILYLTVA